MRKLVIVLALFTVAIATKAQKIEMDKEIGGIRTILTDDASLKSFTDKVALSVGLSASKFESGWKYSLTLQMSSLMKISVKKGDVLEITTTDGSILKLESTSDKVDETGKSQAVGSKIYTTYSIITNYNLSEEQIEAISKGVKSIKVGLSPQDFTKDFKKDKMGKEIYARYKLLKKQIGE